MLVGGPTRPFRFDAGVARDLLREPGLQAPGSCSDKDMSLLGDSRTASASGTLQAVDGFPDILHRLGLISM